MKYLLYCVLRRREALRLPDTLLGVEDRPVFLLERMGLGAAVSRIRALNPPQELPHLRAYQRVIESFHGDPASAGVVPMRYGCQFEKESQILRHLEESGLRYRALLDELEGCEEMGIRILVQKSESAPPPGPERRPTGPGWAFLGARMAHYDREEQLARDIDRIRERCISVFAGLFVKSRAETLAIPNPAPRAPTTFISLYFLVPRVAVAPFRRRYRNFSRKESAKLLLSGPWPPYNFVLPETTPRYGSV